MSLINKGPSIYVAQNDQEAITIVNQLSGNNYTSIGDALAWVAGQDDIYVQNKTSEDIVTDGLVLYLDTTSVESYPKIGNIIYDLSGNGNNGILINGPNFNEDFLTLDGLNDKITLSNISHSYLLSSTIFVTFKIISYNTNGKYSIAGYDFNGGNYSNATTGLIYLNSDGKIQASVITTTQVYRIVSSQTIVELNKYYCATLSKDTDNGTLKLYINGILEDEISFDISSYAQWGTIGQYVGNNNFIIGSYNTTNWGSGPYLNGSVQSVYLYNKILSYSEIQNIYIYNLISSFKSRVYNDNGYVIESNYLYNSLQNIINIGIVPNSLMIPVAGNLNKIYSIIENADGTDFNISTSDNSLSVNKDGSYENISQNNPVFNFDIINKEFKGIHIASEQKNLFSFSEGNPSDNRVSQNNWNIGLNNKLTLNNAGGTINDTYYGFTGEPSKSYTGMCFVKTPGITPTTGVDGNFYFRMGDGGSISNQTMTHIGNSIYFYTGQITLPSTFSGTTNGLMGPVIHMSGGTKPPLEFSGMMVVEGLVTLTPYNYIRTIGSQLTRTKDSYTSGFLNYKSTSFTFYCDIEWLNPFIEQGYSWTEIGASPLIWYIRRLNTRTVNFWNQYSQQNLGSYTNSINDRFKLSIVFNGTNIKTFVNGNLVQTTIPTNSQPFLNFTNNGNYKVFFSGHANINNVYNLKSYSIYAYNLTDQQAIDLTTI